MTAVAMPLDKLDVWLQGRTGAAATNLSMLDGFVTAIVAGPVSMDPPEWICPLLGIEIDAFNHGGTPEFAAISAVAVRHNAIVETLSNAPKTFEPIFARKPNPYVARDRNHRRSSTSRTRAKAAASKLASTRTRLPPPRLIVSGMSFHVAGQLTIGF